MKSFLVPIGGSDTDEPLLATALAAARPFSGHLHFVHVHISAGEAISHIPHAGFAMGPALTNVLTRLETAAATRSTAAAEHFRDFCARSRIDIREVPSGLHGVTASWQEAEGDALGRIITRARHCDLVVVGRARRPNGLPADFLDQLLIGCGRPMLIADVTPRPQLTGTIMVCWKECVEAARAMGAAMPFLVKADRVIVVSVAENGADVTDSLDDVTRSMAWNGVKAETRIIAQNGRSVPDLLLSAAHDCSADLVVMGAYGTSRMRQILFGGCTHAAVHHAEQPVLLMH